VKFLSLTRCEGDCRSLAGPLARQSHTAVDPPRQLEGVVALKLPRKFQTEAEKAYGFETDTILVSVFDRRRGEKMLGRCGSFARQISDSFAITWRTPVRMPQLCGTLLR